MDNSQKVPIREAAKVLGLTEDAIRKRIQRGEMQAEKVGKRWLVVLDRSKVPSQNGVNHVDGASNLLLGHVQDLQGQLRFLQDQLTAKDHQLSEKDKQLRALMADLEGWQEQVRYKELQIAQLQDRMIPLPPGEEPEPAEQGSEVREPATAQAAGSENVLSRFWRWFVGGD